LSIASLVLEGLINLTDLFGSKLALLGELPILGEE
jgi:hypothetical protein